MDRLGGWVSYFITSLVVLGSIIDDFTIGSDDKINFIFATALISTIISVLYILGHFNSTCVQKCIGTLFELVITIITAIFWIITISYIQNPKNLIATQVFNIQNTDEFKDGQELILNANLYFFSWLALACAIHQASSIFKDRNSVADQRFTYWFILTFFSIVLIANNTNGLDMACNDIEDNGGGNTCSRSRYAIGVGSIGLILGLVIIGMALCGKNSFCVHLVCSFVLVVLYFFGVALLTSASGPARMMGNTYFAVWGGFGVSSMILYDLLFDKMVPTHDISDADGRHDDSELGLGNEAV